MLWNVESEYIGHSDKSNSDSDVSSEVIKEDRKRKFSPSNESSSKSSVTSVLSSKVEDDISDDISDEEKEEENSSNFWQKDLSACRGPHEVDDSSCSKDDSSTESSMPNVQSKKVLPACQFASCCLVSTTSNAGCSSLSHVDLTEDVSYDKLHATTSALQKVARTEQKIFVGIAWATMGERNLFKRFPHIIHCDVTGDTDSTQNHLLTFTGRTTAGKQFIFLHMLIHNQRQSSF